MKPNMSITTTVFATRRMKCFGAFVVFGLVLGLTFARVAAGQGGGAAPAAEVPSAMANPYQMLENWPHLGDIKPGAAIGIIPDGRGGTWLHHRSEPPILHFDAAGNILKSFGNGMFVQAHGFCQDRDGNFWAGDSGPFTDTPGTAGRGYQL